MHKLFIIVYKKVSLTIHLVVERMGAKKSVQNWLIRSINDPIVKILSESSNLTRKQLESLLIDFLAINLTGKFLKNEEKANA